MKRVVTLSAALCALLTGCGSPNVPIHESKQLCPQGARWIKLHEGGIEQIKCK